MLGEATMSNTDHTPVPRPAVDDESLDGDPVDIQRLLAWYFHSEDAPRPGDARDLRDAA
jgi:hypothetical protein